MNHEHFNIKPTLEDGRGRPARFRSRSVVRVSRSTVSVCRVHGVENGLSEHRALKQVRWTNQTYLLYDCVELRHSRPVSSYLSSWNLSHHVAAFRSDPEIETGQGRHLGWAELLNGTRGRIPGRSNTSSNEHSSTPCSTDEDEECRARDSWPS